MNKKLYTAQPKARISRERLVSCCSGEETANPGGCYRLTGENTELGGLMNTPLSGTTTNFSAQKWYSYSRILWRLWLKTEKGLGNSKQIRSHESTVGLEFSTGETLWTIQVWMDFFWTLVFSCRVQGAKFCFHPECHETATAFLNKYKTWKVNAIFLMYHIPIGTVGSVLKLVPIKKSPVRAGLSYTHGGNTGMGWP